MCTLITHVMLGSKPDATHREFKKGYKVWGALLYQLVHDGMEPAVALPTTAAPPSQAAGTAAITAPPGTRIPPDITTCACAVALTNILRVVDPSWEYSTGRYGCWQYGTWR
eukprot:SAG25_NODE_4854_length_740_cov_2.199688_2_plen_111_part_00